MTTAQAMGLVCLTAAILFLVIAHLCARLARKCQELSEAYQLVADILRDPEDMVDLAHAHYKRRLAKEWKQG